MPEIDSSPSTPSSSAEGAGADSPPAPAPSAAAPVAAAAAPPQAPTTPSPTSADLAAAAQASEARRQREDENEINAVLAKHGLAKARQPAAPDKETPKPAAPAIDAAQATEDATAEDSPADASPSLPLSDDDARMLQRMGIDPDALPDDPTRREKALAQHRKVFDRLSSLASENGRLKKTPGQQQTSEPEEVRTAQTQRQPSHPPQVDAAWQQVDEVLKDFGDDVTPRLRGAVESLVQTALAAVPAPDTSAQQALWRRLEQDDFNRGIEAATFPDGVHKSDAKIRGQLLEETQRQYQAECIRRAQQGQPPPAIEEFNFEHAAQRAVPIVFAKQLAAQAKAQADERRRKQVSGLPDAGSTRTPTVKANADPEEADREYIRGFLKKHGLPVGAS
jgi:hypothetical protein